MKRKLYFICISTGSSRKLSFTKGKASSTIGGGPYISLFLTDDEKNILSNIIYDENIYHFNEKRSMYIPKEVIMDQLYKKARWLFED